MVIFVLQGKNTFKNFMVMFITRNTEVQQVQFIREQKGNKSIKTLEQYLKKDDEEGKNDWVTDCVKVS